MKILVTGGSGLVGKNIRNFAIKHNINHELLTPDHQQLDLLNYDSVSHHLRKMKPELIIHAAGLVGGIKANIANPVRFLVDNTDMAKNLLLAARSNNINKVINLGSSCMYPKNAKNPISEEDLFSGPLETTNEGYAIAKIFAARLCDYISEEPDFSYKTLIPCNLYGQWDTFDETRSHMIPAAILKIYRAQLNNNQSVSIWGDGTARREFMYASDFADFIFTAVARFNELPPLINVGVGSDHSINEYYETIAETIGYKGTFIHDLDQPTGMNQKLVCTKKLNVFGWRPKTSLQMGIQETFNYYLRSTQD